MMVKDILVPKLFNEINSRLGGALTVMESDDKVIGREEEMMKLRVTLNKKERPVALLLGGHGTGKSAIARSYMNELRDNGIYVEMFQLKVGLMGSNSDQLKARMNTLLEELKVYKDEAKKVKTNAEIILFIDEVHTVVSVFGENSKLGGDLLKESLAEAEKFIKVITATTSDEYQKYISGDLALARRLNNIAINEPSPSLTFNILKDWLVKISNKENKDYTNLVSDKLLKKIIEVNRAYNEDDYEPAKSINVLSSLVSDSEIYGQPPSEKTLARVLRQYNIQLGFDLDPNEVMRYFKSRIKGQPLATQEYENIILRIAFQLYPDSNRPRASILAVGTTGTGKTEACKTLAYAIHGDRKAYVNISMTDYSDKDGANRLLTRIGTAVKENPNSIILLDEIEKASDEAHNVLLPVIDEGILRYEFKGRDGTFTSHKVKLSNAIVIATSNAGAEVLKTIQKADDVQYIGEDMTDEYKVKSKSMIEDVEESIGKYALKPEFVARFDTVIPFRTLEDDTLLDIATRELNELLGDIYDRKHVHITLPPDKDWSDTSMGHYSNAISMYIVKERMGDSNNAQAKGARSIKKIINKDILPPIMKAIMDNPDITHFELDTNGRTRFENKDVVESQGLIEVRPIY
ncbi:AAA family ATPase [Staphylococcus chromogenes]|uniref:AAA family ATPase n=1 Tax=Staphylococcus chromogenes TaxID=46126 RepID=UPI00188FE81C|nr:AAA family ATPase [Staphylococcus chromogenes]HDF3152079.1 ATP-dependent Clp protease ATP-binding subunit [Staphylococcus aureus]